MQELRADAPVEPDPARDVLHIAADLLAKVRHFVHESDLGRQERVRGILDQFGRAARGEQQRRFVEEQRAVDFAHDLAAEIVLGADDDAVGTLEVADGRAFAQEFRIGNHRDPMRRAAVAQDPLNLVAGSHRHGRLGNDHRVVRKVLAHFARDGIDEREVGVPVAAARGRAHGDEDGARAPDALGKVGGEREAAGLDVAGDQRIETRLVDRHHAGVQPVDLRLVLVDADDIVTEIGETRPRNQAHIARAYHRNLHANLVRSNSVRPLKPSGVKSNPVARPVTARESCGTIPRSAGRLLRSGSRAHSRCRG